MLVKGLPFTPFTPFGYIAISVKQKLSNHGTERGRSVVQFVYACYVHVLPHMTVTSHVLHDLWNYRQLGFFSTACKAFQQREGKSLTLQALYEGNPQWGIHWWLVDSLHKGTAFPYHDTVLCRVVPTTIPRPDNLVDVFIKLCVSFWSWQCILCHFTRVQYLYVLLNWKGDPVLFSVQEAKDREWLKLSRIESLLNDIGVDEIGFWSFLYLWALIFFVFFAFPITINIDLE